MVYTQCPVVTGESQGTAETNVMKKNWGESLISKVNFKNLGSAECTLIHTSTFLWFALALLFCHALHYYLSLLPNDKIKI